jgi:hypothetical protein
MTIAKRRSGSRRSAELADNMADAVTYLSRVADGAGMEAISAELLSIREQLEREAQAEQSAAGHRRKRASRRDK